MKELTLTQYQQQAKQTAIYPKDKAIEYVLLGLTGEVGEIANKIKKRIRGDTNTASNTDLQKELGDVLWYVAMLAEELEADLGELAQKNLTKLQDRSQRGVIKGAGDNR
jgi:NTP pyrophosphatase (non-canonical NTP hydrolase)